MPFRLILPDNVDFNNLFPEKYIRRVFPTLHKPYVQHQYSLIVAHKVFRSSGDVQRPLLDFLESLESDSILIFPNASLTLICALPSVLFVLKQRRPDLHLSFRFFMGNFGFGNQLSLNDYLRSSVFSDLSSFLPGSNICLKFVLTPFQYRTFKSYKSVNLSFTQVSYLPLQEKACLSQYRQQESTIPTSLDFIGMPVPSKNNLLRYLKFVALAQSLGFRGVGRLYLTPEALSLIEGKYSSIISQYFKIGRFKIIQLHDSSSSSYYHAFSKIQAFVTFSNGSFFTDVLGSSSRIKEALMLNKPVISNSDSINDFASRVHNKISLIEFPFDSNDVIKCIKKLHDPDFLSIDTSEHWLQYCDSPMWAASLF